MKLQKPKGTADLLPAETAKWQYIEEIARGVFNDYNFKEIHPLKFSLNLSKLMKVASSLCLAFLNFPKNHFKINNCNFALDFLRICVPLVITRFR